MSNKNLTIKKTKDIDSRYKGKDKDISDEFEGEGRLSQNDSFISNTYDIFFNLSLSDNITMLFWKAGHKRLFGVSKCTYLI